MIPYPISKLHCRITSEKSSNCCDTSDNSSVCTSLSSMRESCESKYISKPFCNQKPNYYENKCKCEDITPCKTKCNDYDCYPEEICRTKKDSCEKILNFSENQTCGILKITKIRCDLGSGALKIFSGNCVDLNSKLFDGILTLIITVCHSDSVYIKYNTCNKILINKMHHIVFKRKTNCTWKLISMYEFKKVEQKCQYKKIKKIVPCDNVCDKQKHCHKKNSCSSRSSSSSSKLCKPKCGPYHLLEQYDDIILNNPNIVFENKKNPDCDCEIYENKCNEENDEEILSCE